MSLHDCVFLQPIYRIAAGHLVHLLVKMLDTLPNIGYTTSLLSGWPSARWCEDIVATQRIPQIIAGYLRFQRAGDDHEAIPVDSAAWYTWLDDTSNRSFSIQTSHGTITVRREQQRASYYWYAYHWRAGQTRKTYLGKSTALTWERLQTAARSLLGPDTILTSPAALRIYLLGSPYVTHVDQQMSLPGPKALALLAYFALAHMPPTREQLLALLWPESPSAAARKNLRNTLWAIRQTLGHDVVEQVGARLALRSTVWIDAVQFEQQSMQTANAHLPVDREAHLRALKAALALYRGPFLDGLVLTNAPDLELWLTTERERFEQRYLRLLRARVEAHRQAQHWGEVVAVAEQALQHDPLQEPLYRALMEAHTHMGDRVTALRHYADLHALLDRELGVEPLSATDAVRDAVLRGTLQPPLTIPKHSPSDERVANGPASLPPFIGRQDEQAALDAALREVMGGQTRVVLIRGELGIGKTRLWHAWAARLPPEIHVLETGCLDTMQSLPFAPLIALLRSPESLERLGAVTTPIPSIWLAEIGRLVPELRLRRPDLPAPMTLPAAEERRRVFEALLVCLQALGSVPLILFLDDLHWADQTTLEWLSYLVERLRDQALLLVVAYRPEDITAALAHRIASWTREGRAQRLHLGRFTPTESAALIDALAGDPTRTADLHEQSAGNPYLLSELVRGTPDNIPTALIDVVHARLERLPDSARQVVQAAVVQVPDIDIATLRRTSGRSEEETVDALDILIQANVLIEADGQYAFAHPLVATVVRESLSTARRTMLHRRAAQALETIHAQRLASIAGRLAVHYQQAGDQLRGAHYLELAAEHALSLAAPVEAAAFYRQALNLERTWGGQMGLGRALVWQGDLVQARAAFEAAVHTAQAQADRRGAAQACIAIARTYFPATHPVDVEGWVQRALSEIGPDDDPEVQIGALLLLGTVRLDTGQSLLEAEDHIQEAVRLSQGYARSDLLASSHFVRGKLLAQRGDLEGAVAAFRESSTLAHLAGDPWQEVLGYNNAAYHALLLGDLQAARTQIDAGLAVLEAHALHGPRQWLYSTRGEIALAEQQWDEAETWFRNGLAIAEQDDNRVQTVNYHANLALVARGRGELDAARHLLQTAHSTVLQLQAPELRTQIELWLAEVYHQQGNLALAREILARVMAGLVEGAHQRLQARVHEVYQQLVSTGGEQL